MWDYKKYFHTKNSVENSFLLPFKYCRCMDCWTWGEIIIESSVQDVLWQHLFDLIFQSCLFMSLIKTPSVKIQFKCHKRHSSSSLHTLVFRDLHLIWTVLMNSHRAKQLLSVYWSHISYIPSLSGPSIKYVRSNGEGGREGKSVHLLFLWRHSIV